MNKPIKEYAKEIVEYIQHWNSIDNNIPTRIDRLPLLQMAMQFYADPSKKNFLLLDAHVNLYNYDQIMYNIKDLFLNPIRWEF